MRKIALVVGHNERSKGAYSSIIGMSEYDYYKAIALEITRLSPDIDIYIRKPAGGYGAEMRPVIKSINLNKYDFVLELHFNSVQDTRANGALCLVHHSSTEGKRIANRFLEKLCKQYQTKNKGLIEIQNSKQRGGYGISMTKCPYVLIEPFFANNKEAEKFKNIKLFANFIVKFLEEE